MLKRRCEVNKSSILRIAAILLIISAGPSFCGTNRAVSLSVLESVVQSAPSAEAARLCGITRVSGYVVDKRGHDIILFGKVDPAYPPIYLEDFIVALRNSRMAYATRKGHTYYYAPPGCSIDPDPKVLRELQRIGDKISNTSDLDERRNILDEWQSAGHRPQKVRVLGVPFYTHFAKVMVDADYYMKRLVNGSVDLGISGFPSLMDMSIGVSKKAMQSGEGSAPENSLNRFWFCPGESSYEEENGTFTLTSCRVKLLTEHEFLSVNGQLAGSGRTDPLAQRFAESFSAHYAAIAAARPIYKELEGLFRFVALARLMKENNSFAAAGNRLPYLTSQCRIASTPVWTLVPGLTNCRELSDTREVADGHVEMQGLYVSCGGVSMDVHPKRVKTVRTAKTPKTARTAKATGARKTSSAPARKAPSKIIQARKSAKSLYWDF